MKNPTASIGLPVYNGENYLTSAIESILSQTFRDFELIISDNASTDRTMDICRGFAEKDSRIRYYKCEKNMGASWNFNRVFHLARGEYFQWACHDDVWTPTLLHRFIEILRSMPDVVLCYCKTTFIDELDRPIRSIVLRPRLLDAHPHERFRAFLKYHLSPNECNPVLGLFRTGMLKQTPLIGNYPASDMILLGEIAIRGKCFEIPECLFLRRDHPLTSVRANPEWEDRAVFFDPTKKGKVQIPSWRWFFEWLISIGRCRIGPGEKMRCAIELGKWANRNRTRMKKELKSGVRKYIQQRV